MTKMTGSETSGEARQITTQRKRIPIIPRDNPIFLGSKFNTCNANYIFKERNCSILKADKSSIYNGNIDDGFCCSVPILPRNFPLEPRNSLQLSAAAAVSTRIIFSKIVNFFRSKSVHYSYRKESGRFYGCSSSNTLRFVIQLWKKGSKSNRDKNKNNSNNDNNNDNNSIRNNNNNNTDLILEVQRLQGCRALMHQMRKCLFRAIKTGDGMQREKNGTNTDHHFRKSGACTKTLDHKEEKQQQRHYVSQQNRNSCNSYSPRTNNFESMGISLRLLESTRMNEIKMGMESLAIITDSMLVQPDHAKFVCRELLLGETDSLGERLRKHVLRYIQTCEKQSQQQQQQQQQNQQKWWEEKSKEIGNDQQYDSNHLWQMQTLSLRVCANALQETTNTSDTTNAAKRIMANRFIENLEVASQQPEEAALSAKCLRVLLMQHHGGLEITNRLLSLKGTLIAAHQYGTAYHSSLEKESKSLMDTMTW